MTRAGAGVGGSYMSNHIGSALNVYRHQRASYVEIWVAGRTIPRAFGPA